MARGSTSHARMWRSSQSFTGPQALSCRPRTAYTGACNTIRHYPILFSGSQCHPLPSNIRTTSLSLSQAPVMDGRSVFLLRPCHFLLYPPHPHPFPPSLRIGQKSNSVRIIYIIARDSADEIIWGEIQRKHSVLGATVGTVWLNCTACISFFAALAYAFGGL